MGIEAYTLWFSIDNVYLFINDVPVLAKHMKFMIITNNTYWAVSSSLIVSAAM